jgi:alkylation response protein AidB-like acyl-CoA dehydrogenase
MAFQSDSVDRPNDCEETTVSVTTTTPPVERLVTDEMLERFDARTMAYDRENEFFREDFEELRASGYLLASVPTDLGGAGLTLAKITVAANLLGDLVKR